MTENNGHPQTSTAPAPISGRRRTPWSLALVAALFVIAPFLSWYGTWFGRTLSDAQITQYLTDEANPRHEQHALSQIVERMKQPNAHVSQWYPQIAQLAASKHADVRMTAAWAMGQGERGEEFHNALLRLLADDEPIVRRNAALALVAYGDARCRAELIAMLRPYTFNAPLAGELVSVLPAGMAIKREAMLARVKVSADQRAELRSPLPGRIEQVLLATGAQVSVGQPLLTLAPDENTVLNALVALRFVGTADDLPDVERFAGGDTGLTERIKAEAALTATAIRRRAAETGQQN